jgi:ATP-dependent Clp protease adaptor protein ClpS
MSKSPPDRFHNPSDPADKSKEDGRQPGHWPRFAVVLLNNEAANLMEIVRTIMELTHFCRAEATNKMWQAHHSGRSLLLKTHRERAELYVEQFAAKGMHVTVEAA